MCLRVCVVIFFFLKTAEKERNLKTKSVYSSGGRQWNPLKSDGREDSPDGSITAVCLDRF